MIQIQLFKTLNKYGVLEGERYVNWELLGTNLNLNNRHFTFRVSSLKVDFKFLRAGN